MAIKKLLSRINHRKTSADDEKCEVPSLRDKKPQQNRNWRKKFSLPTSNARRRNSLTAFSQSTSLPCFKAGSPSGNPVMTGSASSALFADNNVDEAPPPPPQRPFSCSTVIMPDILHALRSNDDDHDTPPPPPVPAPAPADESSSFASRYCIASSSKFQPSSICSASATAHAVSPSMHAPPSSSLSSSSSSSSSPPASSIHSKPTATTAAAVEKIELLPSSPPPSSTDLAAIASDPIGSHCVDKGSDCCDLPPSEGLTSSPAAAALAALQVEKTIADMQLAQSGRALQEAMQEIKFLRSRIKYLETQDVEAEDLLRMHTRAQLGLIEYLEGEDDLAVALERFKRQLIEGDNEQQRQDSASAASSRNDPF